MDIAIDDLIPVMDLEQTPEFNAWKNAKIQEWMAYLKTAWKLEVPAEKLVLMEENIGFPDPDRRQIAHKIVGSNLFFKLPGQLDAAINPATGRRMAYVMWRELDQPVVAAPESLDTTEQ